MRRVIVMLLVPCIALGAHSASASSRLGSPIWTRTLTTGAWDFAIDRTGGVVITDAGGVLAFRPSGATIWRAKVDDPAITTPALDDNLVLIARATGTTAFSRADGAQRWQQSTGAEVSSLALTAGRALIGDEDGALAVVDTATGALRWSVTYDGVAFGASVDRSGRTVVVGWRGLDNATVRAFDLDTGTFRWGYRTGLGMATPVVRGTTVYIAQGDDNYHAAVHAVDLATGEVRWQTAVPDSFEDTIEPAIEGRELVVVDHAGIVTMLDTATGHVRWHRDVGQFVLATRVSLTGHRVTFVDFSGDVFVLDRRSGRVVAVATAADLGGFVAAAETTPWPRNRGILLATRLASERLQLRRLP